MLDWMRSHPARLALKLTGAESEFSFPMRNVYLNSFISPASFYGCDVYCLGLSWQSKGRSVNDSDRFADCKITVFKFYVIIPRT